jgi:hypothetical protein
VKFVCAMLAHLANRRRNNRSLLAIKDKPRCLQVGYLIFQYLFVRRHVRCAISIVVATIYRTALLAVQPSPITTKRNQVSQRLSPVLKIDVIAFRLIEVASVALPNGRASDTIRPLTRQQIFKTQLRVVGLQMLRAGDSRHIQSFTHRVQMKTNNARSQTHGRNATLLGQATNSRFAHLKDFGELLRGEKFFAVGHFLECAGLTALWIRLALIQVSTLKGSRINPKRRQAAALQNLFRHFLISQRYPINCCVFDINVFRRRLSPVRFQREPIPAQVRRQAKNELARLARDAGIEFLN